MSYYCDICIYTAKNQSNFINHKKTKRHLQLSVKKEHHVPKNDNKLTLENNKLTAMLINVNANTAIEILDYNCNNCDFKTKHKSSLSRHKKNCNIIDNKLLSKIVILEKEKEFMLKLEKEKDNIIKEKTELLNNFMSNSNILLNKANDNTKVTAEAIKTVSMSALKYANEKFQNTPALLPLENFNINNLDFDNENDKAQLVEILIYNAKQKSLDKLLGDHIVKNYKKDNPAEQSFHTTDCSRLNFIVRELIENALSWSIDKNGIKICKDIIKPLIKKCINALLEHQKVLLQNMGTGNFSKQKEVELIIDVIMSIDSGSLEVDINKYIAPYFNLSKKLNE
jgi:hypothetical protein